MFNFIFSAILVFCLGLGLMVGYFIRKFLAVRRADTVETTIERLLTEAKAKQKELILQAKDKALKVIDEAKKEEAVRRQEIKHLQTRLEKRETLFDQKLLDLESKQQRLYDKASEVEKVKKRIEAIKFEQMKKLEQVAALTQEEARKVLLDHIEKQAKEDLLNRLRKMENEAQEELEKKARDILSVVIQRCASSQASDITTTTVSLPSDEMKGRIIGREGRNIKTIEQLTGVEIVVDDTPQAITISGFSPIRRHVAKRALDRLILDGRIHPTKIEEAIEAAKKEIALEIKKAGEDALYELGITGFDPKLVQIIGRLKFRTSYGQNILQHSIEVAHLSELLAQELGADVTIAKKGGLLHDIGKAVDHDVQGTHPEIGYSILQKFNLPEEIAYNCLGHHEDKPKTLEAIIVKVADAISGARPGARKDTFEHYLQRLEELEKLASTFAGVEKSYAIQAGREVRIFVMPELIDDLAAHKLARDVAHKIEEELKYPGEIKVNVIRETRVEEYAR